MVMMDFSKTFHLVPHQRLPLKLRHFGFTGKMHSWTQNFMTMRKQQVVLEGVSFSPMTVTSCILLRTILDPLHFILCLNDLPERISSQIRILADDCILYREINTLNDCHEL